MRLLRHTTSTEDGKPSTEYTSPDGRYRYWVVHHGWRRYIRWAQRNVPDHALGWYHGAAQTFTEAVRATDEHREQYHDD